MGDVASWFGLDVDPPKDRGPSLEEQQAELDRRAEINKLSFNDLAATQAAAAGKSSLKRPSGLGMKIQ